MIEIDAKHLSGQHTKYSIESGKIAVIEGFVKVKDQNQIDPITNLLLKTANGIQVPNMVLGNQPGEVRDYVFNGMPVILREEQMAHFMSNMSH